MPRNEPRVYRHYSWSLLTAGAVLTAAFVGGAVDRLREPSIDAVCAAAFLLLVWAALMAWPLATLRWRTVVDDEAVTQYWLTNTYRIPLAEITGLERDADFARWFLRLRAGDRTYEVIPCYVLRRPGGAFGTAPPRKLLTVEADIQARRELLAPRDERR